MIVSRARASPAEQQLNKVLRSRADQSLRSNMRHCVTCNYLPVVSTAQLTAGAAALGDAPADLREPSDPVRGLTAAHSATLAPLAAAQALSVAIRASASVHPFGSVREDRIGCTNGRGFGS